MKRSAKPKNIALGEGIFKIDNLPIGLTRDGGKFTVEYSYRAIEADGDRQKVAGRIMNDGGVPKLEISHLELLTEFEKLHPGLLYDTTTKPGYTIIRGLGKIDDENDYHSVEFNGITKDNREICVKIDKAINLENLELEFKSKNEVVDKVVFEGVEDEEQETTDEGWSIEYKNSENEVKAK